MEINLDDHLKFAPTCLADLVRWFRDYSVWTFVAFMKLEVDFLHICLHIFVEIRFDINSPGNSNSPGKEIKRKFLKIYIEITIDVCVHLLHASCQRLERSFRIQLVSLPSPPDTCNQ